MERWRKWLPFPCVIDSKDERHRAERDNCRLRSNWVFVVLTIAGKTVNTICVLPTNHQFIINPTSESLNVTQQKIEPGLEQSEAFYSMTYVVMFLSHAIAAVTVGFLFNLVPTWYLFLASTLSHTSGYLLYSLATNGWMMMLARSLAGLSQGAVMSLAYGYFAVSYERYTENLRILGKEKGARMKGYLYSTNSIGNVLGIAIGVGFPTILAQFPNTPQFRPAGWFCVAFGVVLLLLQLALFHGEHSWHVRRILCTHCSKTKPSFKKEKDKRYKDLCCQIFLPLFVVLVGGLKGMRYAVTEVLLNPIVADSFGFSEMDMSYIYLLFLFSRPVGLLLLYGFQYFKVNGYFLTVIGLLCTMSSLLIMTDWQAIGNDSCMEYSLFSNPHLRDKYRVELTKSNITEFGLVSVQSLEVVDDDVYQLAVNRCESAAEYCNWIPNSRVTHKHCTDCQPICRDTRHTLNFVQFIVGIVLLISTMPLMYTGVFLLLSESLNKQYQGLGAGAMVALIGASRSAFPLLLDALYEYEQKTTFLPMLVQVGIYLPLLIGLLLLYPCFERLKKSLNTHKVKDDNENKLLIPSNSQEKCYRNSDTK